MNKWLRSAGVRFWSWLGDEKNNRAFTSLASIAAVIGLIVAIRYGREIYVDVKKIKADVVETKEVKFSGVCISESFGTSTLGYLFYKCSDPENVIIRIEKEGATTTMGF